MGRTAAGAREQRIFEAGCKSGEDSGGWALRSRPASSPFPPVFLLPIVVRAYDAMPGSRCRMDIVARSIGKYMSPRFGKELPQLDGRNRWRSFVVRG